MSPTGNGNPFNNPNNVVKPWVNRNADGSVKQLNEKIVNPDSSDYGSHRWADVNDHREGVNWGNNRPPSSNG